jgi:cation diffusion facilitator family transporter
LITGSSFPRGAFVSKISVVIFVVIGTAELFSGYFSGSVALIADGSHTLSDALISTIVWLGLKVSGRAPDGKFHYGYYRVESFSAVISAFVMVGVGIFILIRSYQVFLEPTEIQTPLVPLVTAGVASVSFWTMGFYKHRIAKEEKSEALQLDAYNTMKSGLSSLFAFVGVFLSSFFIQTDALAGIGISFFIFVVAYTSVRGSALVLLDACECTDVIKTIKLTSERIEGVDKVLTVKLRHSGPYIFGDLHIQVDGGMKIKESDRIIGRIKATVKDLIPNLSHLTVEVQSESEEEQASRSASGKS